MKIKATNKEILNQADYVIGFGYCKIQNILRKLEIEPTLYNAGVYGWNCDFYPIDELFGVATGYNIEKACKLNAHNLSSVFLGKIEKLEQNADNLSREDLKAEFINLLELAQNGEFNKAFQGWYDNKLWASGKTRAELKAYFYDSRSTMVGLYKLDHLPKYSDLKIVHN